MKPIAEIRRKRERLLVRAAAQRRALARQIEPWQGALGLADRGIAAARYLRSRPALIAAAALIFAALQPRRALRWTRLGFLLWRAWRFARGALRSALASRVAP